MGEVISLVRHACPCGWKIPSKVSIEFHGFVNVNDLTVKYECPDCGRWLEANKIKEQRT